MKCAEVKNLLSQYIEGDLKAKTKELLDEHFAGCAACTKELNELKSMVFSLKETPQVEPPPYFLEAVQARLEKPPLLNRILRKLFVPFYIKVPLEALAVTAALILVVIFTHQTPQLQLAQSRYKAASQPLDFKGMGRQEVLNRSEKAAEAPPQREKEMILAEEDLSSASGAFTIPEQTSNYRFNRSFAAKSAPVYSTRETAYSAKAPLKDQAALPEREIILKSQNLAQDQAKLDQIFKDLEISDIKIESHADKVLFSFVIPPSRLELFLLKLQPWQRLGITAEKPTPKEEKITTPILIKLILDTR